MISLVLLDLDGVVRRFDKSRVPAIEAAFRIEPGQLRAEAFSHPRGHRAVTGEITRDEWIGQVGEAVGSIDAARAWLDNWGQIDTDMHRLVGDVRAAGTPVALLTNGTETIPDELDHHGVSQDFDHVFCTSFIGVAKPQPEAFLHVTQTLRVQPSRVFFTDDSPGNVEAALDLGFDAVHFESAQQIRGDLGNRGVIGAGVVGSRE